jgi:hypothetical protein
MNFAILLSVATLEKSFGEGTSLHTALHEAF